METAGSLIAGMGAEHHDGALRTMDRDGAGPAAGAGRTGRFKRTILQLVAPMPKCGRAAKRVLRHLGSYLTYALLSGIIGLVVFTLLMIPAIILLIEGYFDYTLAAEGDPRVLGMGYWVLTTATLTFCLALVFYAMIWKTFGEAYLYGSMVAQDEVRKRLQARTTTWTTAAD